MNVGAERSSSRRPRISTSILSLFGGACTITDETSARMRRIARRRRRVRAVATKQCGQVVEVGAVALQRSWMQSDEFVGDIDFGKLKVNVGALRLQPLDVARDRVRIDPGLDDRVDRAAQLALDLAFAPFQFAALAASVARQAPALFVIRLDIFCEIDRLR